MHVRFLVCIMTGLVADRTLLEFREWTGERDTRVSTHISDDGGNTGDVGDLFLNKMMGEELLLSRETPIDGFADLSVHLLGAFTGDRQVEFNGEPSKAITDVSLSFFRVSELLCITGIDVVIIKRSVMEEADELYIIVNGLYTGSWW